MSEFDGTYRCLSAITAGRRLGAEVEQQLQLTLDGELYRTSKGPQTLFEGRFRIDESKSPWQIDITAVDGPFAGKSAQGLVNIEDDVLTICHTMPGQPRPTEFVSSEANGAHLVGWKTKRIDQ